MSSKPEADAPEVKAPPAKGGAPVIRRVEVAEEEVGQRVMNRHVPAWVISGAVHVLVIGMAVLFLSGAEQVEAKPNDIVSTQVEDPKEEDPILTNEDVGFDAEIPAATASEIEKDANVIAPDNPAEAAGIQSMEAESAPQTAVMGVENVAPGTVGDTGGAFAGEGQGGGAAFAAAGMVGRSGATKDKLVKAGGGSPESEAAVGRGLAWLAKQQQRDGSWKFDGTSNDQIAATGLALLPFLAAGETHKGNGKYRKTVEAGLNWLMGKVQSGGGGFLGSNNMYAIAIGTVALCEAAGMTRDPMVKAKATTCANFVARAQGKNGSWGYTAGTEGDTSIVGWQVQALASAHMAGIKFEKDKVYKDTEKFLDSVSLESGSFYGYREKGKSQTLTPVGLLSRYYMGWTPRHPAYARGVDFLKQTPPQRGYFDMYYYYYATQVVHFFDGPDWHKFWNPRMRDMLVDMQHKAGDAAKIGSWDKDGGFIGGSCGRLGTTCLALLTLEVYYRHLPLYKRDNGGLAELER